MFENPTDLDELIISDWNFCKLNEVSDEVKSLLHFNLMLFLVNVEDFVLVKWKLFVIILRQDILLLSNIGFEIIDVVFDAVD